MNETQTTVREHSNGAASRNMTSNSVEKGPEDKNRSNGKPSTPQKATTSGNGSSKKRRKVNHGALPLLQIAQATREYLANRAQPVSIVDAL